MKSRSDDELKLLLETALPLHKISIRKEHDSRVPKSEGVISWEDPERTTIGSTEEEQRFIDRWILQVVGSKLGYEIEMVHQLGNNGHCMLWFRAKAK